MGEDNQEALEALVADEGARLDADEAAAEEQAEFEQGFSTVSGKPAEKAAETIEEPESADAVKAEADADAPVDDDRDERLAKLEQRLRAAEGRNGSLISQYKELSQKFEQIHQKEKEPTPDMAKMLAAAMSGGEKLATLKTEFPEFADALDEQAKLFGDSVDKRLAELRADADGRVTKDEAREMVKEARQLAQLDIKHPDWEDTCQTAAFAEWYQAQGEDVKELARSDHARDAMALLDRFANDNKLTQAQKGGTKPSTDRLRSAIPATSSASRAAPRSTSEEEDFLAGFKSVRG